MASTFLQDKPKWQLESSVNSCTSCSRPFSSIIKKHHCRACGKIFCGDCSLGQRELPQFGYCGLQTVCKACKVALEGDTTLLHTSSTAVQLMMRDMSFYAFKSELFQMGTRGASRKLLADVKDGDGGNQILSMTTITDDGAVIFKDEPKRRLFSFILKDTITHPYIASPSFAQLRDAKGVVITPYQPQGSLRDLIYLNNADMKKKKITPKSKQQDKYGGTGQPIDIKSIAKYGRQILEALFYLYLHGFPYPHLHSGNILISENDHAQLHDLENSLLCLDPKANREIRKVHATDADLTPEVISFGLVLYEMAHGHEKGDRSLKETKSKCPVEVFPILESILEPSSADSTASLKSLLRLSFFQEVTLDVTVHQVVLTEKWDDRVRAILKLVRAATTKLLTPPVQPSLRSSNSALKLGDGTSSSHIAPSVTHASRTNSKTSLTTSSSSSLARKTSTRNVPSASTSSSVTSPPPAPPAPPAPPIAPHPPSVAKAMPAPQTGRDNLMAAIRSAGGLKSVQKK